MAAYYRRFWRTLRKDFAASTREQMIGALLVIGILVCQIAFGIIRPGEIRANLLSIAWPYMALVGGLFLRHLIRTPYRLDTERETEIDALSERVVKAEAAKTEAERRIYDGRPLIVLRVAAIAGTRERGKPEYVLYVQNCGHRAARWVTIEEARSKCENYRLEFSRVPVVEPGKEVTLACEVSTIGYPSEPATVDEFGTDNGEDTYVVWYDIQIKFRDTDESMQEDTARLCYYPHEHILCSAEVPYTRR